MYVCGLMWDIITRFCNRKIRMCLVLLYLHTYKINGSNPVYRARNWAKVCTIFIATCFYIIFFFFFVLSEGLKMNARARQIHWSFIMRNLFSWSLSNSYTHFQRILKLEPKKFFFFFCKCASCQQIYSTFIGVSFVRFVWIILL